MDSDPNVAALQLSPGVRLLDRYELEGELARGGMGTVWRARHLGLDAPVAIKFATGVTETGAARLFAEARTAANLGSPHIVRVFDIGAEEGVPFLVMELLEGESLEERLRARGALTTQETVSIVEEICRGLSVAHLAGVTHRDLKPSNIFLVPNGSTTMAKIVDFGIARGMSSSLTASGELVGTPRYMSPEQVLDESSVDGRSDLWSLGLVVYECLLGDSPHGRKSTTRIIRDLGVSPFPPPSEQGAPWPAFDDWFAKATSSDASERFATAEEFADALREALDDGEEQATAPAGTKPLYTGATITGNNTTVATVLKSRQEKAPEQPTKKPLLILSAVAVAFGTAAAVVTWGGNEEATEATETAETGPAAQSTAVQPTPVPPTPVEQQPDAHVEAEARDSEKVQGDEPKHAALATPSPEPAAKQPKTAKVSTKSRVSSRPAAPPRPEPVPRPQPPAKKTPKESSALDDSSVWDVRK